MQYEPAIRGEFANIAGIKIAVPEDLARRRFIIQIAVDSVRRTNPDHAHSARRQWLVRVVDNLHFNGRMDLVQFQVFRPVDAGHDPIFPTSVDARDA